MATVLFAKRSTQSKLTYAEEDGKILKLTLDQVARSRAQKKKKSLAVQLLMTAVIISSSS